MDHNSPYYKAHLVVAAARIADHKFGVPPTVSQISEVTGYSIEESQSICNKLKEMEVLKAVLAGDVERMYIKNPLPMEELPRANQGPNMEAEVEKFAKQQAERMANITVKAKDEKQRKKDLFAALEKELKGRVGETKP
ncbi:MAG: hypothetical protein JEZ02_15010 [Desulfatibacillum sp.]|nr:hypothetical protein [Desulfatibacillum sp.]